MSLDDATVAYREAKFAHDWAQGLCIYADQTLSLSITQPVEYGVLEDAMIRFERTEREAYEELEWWEEAKDMATRTWR